MGSGFDGVLNDSWSSRRRASDVKGSGRPGDVSDTGDGSKAEGIKEEEEETQPTVDPGANPPKENSNGAQQSNGSMQLNEEDTLTSQGVPSQDPAPSVPPGIANPDPASIEWSYLDPQGQIQGTIYRCRSLFRISFCRHHRPIPRGYHAEMV